jgi:hypothetical protein
MSLFRAAAVRYADAVRNLDVMTSATLFKRDRAFWKQQDELNAARLNHRTLKEALRVHRKGHTTSAPQLPG